MSLVRTLGFCACLVMAGVGCRAPQPFSSASADSSRTSNQAARIFSPATASTPTTATAAQTTVAQATVAQVSFQQSTVEAPVPEYLSQTPPKDELCLSEFLAEVQARN